jgi:hypothetical protein
MLKTIVVDFTMSHCNHDVMALRISHATFDLSPSNTHWGPHQPSLYTSAYNEEIY